MSYFTYILYSDLLEQFYIGQTQNFNARLERHNKGYVKSTKRGIPWKKVIVVESESRSDAMKLERKLKNFKSQKKIKAWVMEVAGSEK